MPENQNRLGRIDEEYKKEISQIISYQLKNPNVTQSFRADTITIFLS